jgi:hypothetical protein
MKRQQSEKSLEQAIFLTLTLNHFVSSGKAGGLN